MSVSSAVLGVGEGVESAVGLRWRISGSPFIKPLSTCVDSNNWIVCLQALVINLVPSGCPLGQKNNLN